MLWDGGGGVGAGRSGLGQGGRMVERPIIVLRSYESRIVRWEVRAR